MGDRAVRNHLNVEGEQRQGHGRTDRRSPAAVQQGFGDLEQPVDGGLTGQSPGTQCFQFVHPEFRQTVRLETLMRRIGGIRLCHRDMISQAERCQRSILPIGRVHKRAGSEIVGRALREQRQASCQSAPEQMCIEGLAWRDLALHDHGRLGMPPTQLLFPGFSLLAWKRETEGSRPGGMGNADPFRG